MTIHRTTLGGGLVLLLALGLLAYTKHPCELPDGTIDNQCEVTP